MAERVSGVGEDDDGGWEPDERLGKGGQVIDDRVNSELDDATSSGRSAA